MKKLLSAAFLLALMATACKKSSNNNTTPQPPPPQSTNDMNGNWTVIIWDGDSVVKNSWSVIYNATATSATQGTVHFDGCFDGINHNIEDATYTLSNGNTSVSYAKTGGSPNWVALSGNSPWPIQLAPKLLKMKVNGIDVVMTQP